MIQTDNVIKIIWKNIYPINQYKKGVQVEMRGFEETREKIRYHKLIYSFAQKIAFTQENVIPWHIEYLKKKKLLRRCTGW
ncbi:hypothetical protein SAMN02910340_00827 [Methanosarcina thermophila]|uniref:Uncharacterized protein n=1 Tax=Methanosarcina thermophila TaxID=2210 RepID=A0A1I6YFI0_METTE|nr:conserved hypothetical protein [Methanosarcina thermophila]SFT48974.1 hypothetical protein SAMN02910340_00827 [Methanosarcina thermophila]